MPVDNTDYLYGIHGVFFERIKSGGLFSGSNEEVPIAILQT